MIYPEKFNLGVVYFLGFPVNFYNVHVLSPICFSISLLSTASLSYILWINFLYVIYDSIICLSREFQIQSVSFRTDSFSSILTSLYWSIPSGSIFHRNLYSKIYFRFWIAFLDLCLICLAILLTLEISMSFSHSQILSVSPQVNFPFTHLLAIHVRFRRHFWRSQFVSGIIPYFLD